MNDLTKIYEISLSTQDSSLGLVIFIAYLVCLVLIVPSLALLYLDKFKKEFYLLPNLFWYMLITGIVMILCTGFIKIGTITVFKCHLNVFLLSLGYTLIYTPILQKLIVKFPQDNNKYSVWVKKNELKFFSIFIAIDLVLNILMLIKPYHIGKVTIDGGESYQKCDRNKSVLNYAILGMITSYKFVLMFAMLILIFIEWNILSFRIDVRLILASIYLNVITLVVLFIFSSFNINSYLSYYLVQEVFVLIIVLSNYIILYLVRLSIPTLTKEDGDQGLFDHFSQAPTQSTERPTSPNVFSDRKSFASEETNTSNNIFSKMIGFHNMTYTYSENALNNTANNTNLNHNVLDSNNNVLIVDNNHNNIIDNNHNNIIDNNHNNIIDNNHSNNNK